MYPVHRFFFYVKSIFTIVIAARKNITCQGTFLFCLILGENKVQWGLGLCSDLWIFESGLAIEYLYDPKPYLCVQCKRHTVHSRKRT